MGYTTASSKPPIPPSRMRRISRSSSAVVTEGPNHHHRIRIRLSSGGFAKRRCSSATFGPTATAP